MNQNFQKMYSTPTHFLTRHITPQFEECVEKIVNVLQPDRIYLLGVKQPIEVTTSIYLPSPVSKEQRTKFHICVIGSSAENDSTHNQQDKIETLCKDIAPILSWYISNADFIEGEENQPYFRHKIEKDGLLCYSSNPLKVDSSESLPYTPINFGIWFSRSNEFLAGAELSMIRKEYKMCAFHLHQALEQIYIGLTLSRTGMRTKSHNLDRLQRYSDFVLDDAIQCFPRHNDYEERLFQTLKNAYTGSRYFDNYSISGNDCRVLFDRISKLHATYKSTVLK